MVDDDIAYLSALNQIYEKVIEDIARLINELGYVIIYDDNHNVIDILPQSEIEQRIGGYT